MLFYPINVIWQSLYDMLGSVKIIYLAIACSILILGVNLNYAAQQQNTTHIQSPEFDGTLRRIYTPILMYHYVSPIPSNADEYRIGLTVTPDRFRQQLQYLQDNNYEATSLYELHRALMTGNELPLNPVIFTFDDGHIDHYNYVLPLLLEYDFYGTFFIITGFADNNMFGHLNWEQIVALSEAGMDVEAHSKTHPDLRQRDHEFLVYQILGSIESLSAHTRDERHMFAYPAGKYDEATLQIAASIPVYIAVTTRHGTHHTSDDTLELSRLRMTQDIGPNGLLNVLDGSINR